MPFTKTRVTLIAVLFVAMSASADSSTIRVQATPTWSVVVPRNFRTINNGDSFQATDAAERRIVYVSALVLAPRGGPVPSNAELVDQLMNSMRRKAGPESQAGLILKHHAADLEGRATITRDAKGFTLRGIMLATGSAGVCVVSFPNEKEQQWATETWRSLERSK